MLKHDQEVIICLSTPFAKDTQQPDPSIPLNAIQNTMHFLPNNPVPDITGANSINQFLAGKGSKPEIRMANSVQFADLHRAPAVLIGASAMNPWIARLGTDLRYNFGESEQGRVVKAALKAAGSEKLPGKTLTATGQPAAVVTRP